MALKGPITYTGYDSEGKAVATCTAVDANTLLDPQEVKTAIDAVVKAFNETLTNSMNGLRDLTADTDEAIVVKGTKLTDTVNQTADEIGKIPEQVESSFEELYQASIEAHDYIQTEINKQAHDAVQARSDVQYVEPNET